MSHPATGVPALGAQLGQQEGERGVRFSVWAPEAVALEVCLFEPTPGGAQTQRLPMAPSGNGVWQAFASGAGAGQHYGLRAHGPWQPSQGQRFNPARLLLDPYALALVGHTDALARQTGHLCADPLQPQQAWHDHRPNSADNAAHMPRCLVVDAAAELAAGLAIAAAPRVADDRVVIFEAHVKALTQLHPAVPPEQRGSYAALAHPAVVSHLKALGITTVCLLPVHAHSRERHLLARGLHNHWGYNPLNVFCAEGRYAASTQAQAPQTANEASALRAEFRHMVHTLHQAGLEVVLDVVFNHTAESDPDGPTLSWRGLGQSNWYAMAEHGAPHNFSGCGNSLNVSQPRVLQWVLDSLRWWVLAYGVDGFRFDLGVSLGRQASLGHAFHPHAPLLAAMQQDPVLRGVRLIAEPWDIGPNGHHTGGFAPGWLEWNDGFRDTVRAFWLGHPNTRGQFADAVCASRARFDHGARLPLASVHMLCAHDGFTLADLTAFAHKHNQANGEDNRDGHGHNLGNNGGVEGASDDPAVQHQRGLWRRALLATVFCAQGTPQLLAGDELGHSQQGNNNAYCQDNTLTWIDWAQADQALAQFVGGLAALRRQHPGLRHPRWFSGEAQPGTPGITWRAANGTALAAQDWQDPAQRSLAACIVAGDGHAAATEALFIVWHTGPTSTPVVLPPGAWRWRLDSAQAWVAPDAQDTPNACEPRPPANGTWTLREATVCVLAQDLPPKSP